MMMESLAPLPCSGVVPDVGDFDFDLGTIDTFDDMDIDMESFNLIEEHYDSDPFGNMSFEQSLGLVDLKSFGHGKDSGALNILDDFDVKEPIKQDCMWSAFQDAAARNSSLHMKQKKTCRSTTAATQQTTGLTPPTSYINEHLRRFDTPLQSDEDSGEELDLVAPALCSRVQESDHCYTSQQWSNRTSAAAPLTPPQSSEDEDSSSLELYTPATPSPASIPLRRKAALTEVENDRFNSVVKNILLKSSVKTEKRSPPQEKAKFRFSVTTRNKTSLLTTKCLMQKSKTMSRAHQSKATATYLLNSIKENAALPPPSQSPTFSRQKSRSGDEAEEARGARPDHLEARNTHNQMERQRRTDLKNAFDSLKDFVPTIANSDRASKQMVLDKAIDYCKSLKGKESSGREQRKKLVQKRENLQKRLAQLESEMTSCQLDGAAWEIQGW